MRVRIYPEGNVGLADEYNVGPGEALADLAETYAEEWDLDAYKSHNICVEPMDEEAAAMLGWHPAEEDEEDAKPFRLFVVGASLKWSAREVQTFNTSGAS